MSLFSAFSKYNHLTELAEPLATSQGVLTPAARRALVRAALGFATDSITIPTFAATTVAATTVTATTVKATAAQHLALNSGTTATDLAGKTVRINSITNIGTANDLIGFQSKPAQGVAAAKNVIGAEISPRVNDTFALTGSGSLIGLHVDAYLKGTTGDIAGDVRGQQIELVDDTGSSRTVAGNVSSLRFRSNISYTVTGKVCVFRWENAEGTKAWDGLLQLSAALGTQSGTTNADKTGNSKVGTLKVLTSAGTTVHIQLYADS